MSKPRILILENSTAVTGALKSALRSSVYLRDRFEFLFIVPSGSDGIPIIAEHGFGHLELPMKEIRKNFLSLLFYLPVLTINTIRFARIVKREKIDLVVNNDFYNMIPPLYSLFGGKAPYVCYVRFIPSRFPNQLVKLWHGLHTRFSSRIIAVSNVVRQGLPDQRKVIVVGNELPQMEKVAYEPSIHKLLLYPANYIQGKGHEYALEAFSMIAAKHPDWSLRFVGGDMGLQKNKDYRSSLKTKAGQLGITDRVEWLSFVNDMRSQYLEGSVVLNFSESESFSLTCLEGMYYGRAVIATDCGGPAEIIDNDVSGILVPVKDVKKMAEVLDMIMTDAVKREELAATGYEMVRKKFDNEKITGELRAIYQTVLKSRTFNKR